VEKILKLEPSDDSLYSMKAELWILTIKDAYSSLNSALDQDISKVSDPAGYKELVLQMFNGAGLQLEIPFVPDYTTPDEINLVGNTAANLYGKVWMADQKTPVRGVFAAQGPWRYYAESDANFALYKMRQDGQERQLVCEDSVTGLNVMGDWIYFCNITDNYAPYKVRTDGTMKTKLAEDSCSYLCAAGDWVYFSTAGNEGAVYKMRLDGSGRELVANGAKDITVQGDWLYLPSRDERSLTRVRLDGSEQQTLIQGQWNLLAYVYNDCLYYLSDNNGMAIMKNSFDGSDPVEVWKCDGKLSFYTLVENRLIVSMRSRESTEILLALDLDSLEQILKLDNVASESICTDGGNNVYFSDAFDQNAWYKINWETGAILKLE
jgi:hypothetical protein